MGSPSIFSGSDAKILKSNIDLNGNAKVMSGAVDPSSSATDAPEGSMYLSTSTGLVYKKTDAGSSTNWTIVNAIGGTIRTVTSKTTTYPITATDDIIEGDVATTGSFTMTLPAASTNAGQFFTITLTATSGNRVLTLTDGGSFTFGLYTLNESITVSSDGSAYKVDYHYIPSVDTSTTSSWTGSTTGPTKGTVATDTVVWWREGQNMVGRVTYLQSNASGAAAGSGVMMLTVPGGWTIDTTNMNAPANLANGQYFATVLGKGVIGNDTNTLSTAYQGFLFLYDSTHMYIQYQLNNSNAEVFTGASTILFTAATFHYAFEFKIPISGWKQ